MAETPKGSSSSTLSRQAAFYEAHYARAESREHVESEFKDEFLGRIVEKAQIRAPDSVLELGCGHGILTDELLARGATVTALDISEAGIDLLKERHSIAVATGKLTPVVADIDAFLRTKDATFDWVAGSGILHHIEDLTATLPLVRHALKPGGGIVFAPEPNASGAYGLAWRYLAPVVSRILNSEFDWDVEKGTLNITVQNLTSLLKASGFVEIDIVPFQVIPHFRLGWLRSLDRRMVGTDRLRSVALYLAIMARRPTRDR